MSDTKTKILQVLNDNYMINLFSANAREHIANKIIDNLDGNYNSNPAPEGTVAIDPKSVKVTKKVTKESKKDRKVPEDAKGKNHKVKVTPRNVVKKNPTKPNLKKEASGGSLRNLKK